MAGTTTQNGFAFPVREDERDRTPRCMACGYRLAGLGHRACPECGQMFDPAQPETYTRRLPFVWYQYWWPGALLAVMSGLGWSVVFYQLGSLGWGLFLGVPFMLGALIGYRPVTSRNHKQVLANVVVVLSVLLLVVMLMGGGLAGLFCGCFLTGVFVPIALAGFYGGAWCARMLASTLKQTSFSQRAYLPVLLLILLLPGLGHVLQVAFAPRLGPESVSTARVLAMDADAAWDARLFYEEVEGTRPLLHKIGLPMPERIEGEIVLAGDRAVYHYSGGGRIVKQATAVEPGRVLAFEVVEQSGFEDRSLRFIRGQYDFTPVDSNHTRVSLTSHYQPLLRPRVLWRPIERAMAGQLHRHILSGMERRGQRRRFTQTTPLLEARP